MTGKTPLGHTVRGGGGSGRFSASGAFEDSGTFLDFRSENGDTILIRRVLTGKKGVITTVVTISMSGGDKGWKVKSASGKYQGIRGSGREIGGVDDSGKIDITMNGSIRH
jgi:hypothetical protein